MSKTFQALANPNYRLYFAGSVVSNTGTWMMRIAQDWLVLIPLAGGAHAVGLVTALQFLPVLFLTPFAGVLADRVPKRTMLQCTQATMGIFSLISAVAAISGHSSLALVYICAFGLGVGASLDAPARQAFVSEMVDREDLTNAIGLNSASFNIARILGPALAGLLIAWWGSGQDATGWVFALNSVSYIAVIVQLRRMNPALLHTPQPRRLGKGALVDGVRYVAGQPKMVFVVLTVFAVTTFGMNFQITSALMATQEFGKGAGEFGLLGSAFAVGSLTGALMSARRSSIRLRLIGGAAFGFCVALAVSGAMPNYWLFMLCCPLIGFFTLTMLNSANATIQLESSPEMRGRVMALYMTVVQGGTPVGAPIIGWIGAEYGARWTLWAGAALAFAGLGLATVVLMRGRSSAVAQNGVDSPTTRR